ncbi:BTAD domain-containing putative transcriptional regulator [Virgisporangium aurantiacum]|nr:BTAD domain-containing putative transcriptional regulator [Virgisporangium aurantiacum]
MIMGDHIEFRLLGPPEIGGPPGRVWFRSHRQRAVLATLALNANANQLRERLRALQMIVLYLCGRRAEALHGAPEDPLALVAGWTCATGVDRAMR